MGQAILGDGLMGLDLNGSLAPGRLSPRLWREELRSQRVKDGPALLKQTGAFPAAQIAPGVDHIKSRLSNLSVQAPIFPLNGSQRKGDDCLLLFIFCASPLRSDGRTDVLILMSLGEQFAVFITHVLRRVVLEEACTRSTHDRL